MQRTFHKFGRVREWSSQTKCTKFRYVGCIICIIIHTHKVALSLNFLLLYIKCQFNLYSIESKANFWGRWRLRRYFIWLIRCGSSEGNLTNTWDCFWFQNDNPSFTKWDTNINAAINFPQIYEENHQQSTVMSVFSGKWVINLQVLERYPLSQERFHERKLFKLEIKTMIFTTLHVSWLYIPPYYLRS